MTDLNYTLNTLLTGKHLELFKMKYGFSFKQLYSVLELNDAYANYFLQDENKDQILPPMIAILLKLYDRFPELVITNETLINFAQNLIKNKQIHPKFLTICLGSSSPNTCKEWLNSKNHIPNNIIYQTLKLMLDIGDNAMEELFKAAKQEAIARNVNPFITGSWFMPMSEDSFVTEYLTVEQVHKNLLNFNRSLQDKENKLNYNQQIRQQNHFDNGLTYSNLEKFRIKHKLTIRSLSALFGVNKSFIHNKLSIQNYSLLEPQLAILLRIHLNNPNLFLQNNLPLSYYWENFFAPYDISKEQFVIMLGMSYRRVNDYLQGNCKPNATCLKIAESIALIENGYRELFEIVKEESIIRKVNPLRTGIWDEKVAQENYCSNDLEVEDILGKKFDLLPSILCEKTRKYAKNKKEKLLNYTNKYSE